jgi:hypothetical protein
MEKVSENPKNQQLKPGIQTRQSGTAATTPTATPYSQHLELANPTLDNQQQTTTKDRFTRQPKPPPDNQHLTTDRKEKQKSTTTRNAAVKLDTSFVTNLKTTTKG